LAGHQTSTRPNDLPPTPPGGAGDKSLEPRRQVLCRASPTPITAFDQRRIPRRSDSAFGNSWPECHRLQPHSNPGFPTPSNVEKSGTIGDQTIRSRPTGQRAPLGPHRQGAKQEGHPGPKPPPGPSPPTGMSWAHYQIGRHHGTVAGAAFVYQLRRQGNVLRPPGAGADIGRLTFTPNRLRLTTRSVDPPLPFIQRLPGPNNRRRRPTRL